MAQVIGFEYDQANRRTKLKLANGITATYGYDDANQLTSITYRKADNSLIGDLTYQYDNAGRRTKLGGSLYTANKQAPVASASYNAANRLIGWNGATLSYDLNGNLIGDGGRTFVWNARNQLREIRDAAGTTVQASFTYDAFGRRTSKTVGGTASGYMYDGLNVVQELNGASANNATPANVRSNVVTGGIDEYFLRSTGTGTTANPESFLTDALGSVIQLTNASQTKTVGYTYEAYGKTTADNATHSNPFQYTGRENDLNGLYYYRARYYIPAISRFASEDPIGLAGGINTFGYVSGNPILFTDPTGLVETLVSGGVGGLVGVSLGPGVGGFVGAGINVGLGFSGDGVSVVVQLTGTVATGLGAYIGGGAQVGTSISASPAQPGTSFSVQGDANAGWGASKGGSVQIGTDGAGIQGGTARGGVGFGTQVSVGITGTQTWVPIRMPWPWRRPCP